MGVIGEERGVALSDLVQQLRAGTINKSELFKSLSQLQQNGGPTNSSNPQHQYAASSLPSGSSEPSNSFSLAVTPILANSPQSGYGNGEASLLANSSTTSGGFTGQSRRTMISKILEEHKKRALQQQQYIPPPAPQQEYAGVGYSNNDRGYPPPYPANLPPPPGVLHGNGYEGGNFSNNNVYENGNGYAGYQNPAEHHHDNRRHPQFNPNASYSGPYDNYGHNNNMHSGDAYPDWYSDGGEGREDWNNRNGYSNNRNNVNRGANNVLGRRASNGNIAVAAATEPLSVPLRSFSEERARRAEETVRHELLAECTFRPRIKPLPQHYGASTAAKPFLQRVTQWQRDKEKEVVVRKAEVDSKELENCTFTPNINMKSRAAARENSSGDYSPEMDTNERLFYEAQRRQHDRSRMMAEKEEQLEEAIVETCTFQPNLPATTHGLHIRSRYSQAALKTSSFGIADQVTGYGTGQRRRRPAGYDDDQCTFTPQVIGVKENMPTAMQYVQHSVVDRLTGAAFQERNASAEEQLHGQNQPLTPGGGRINFANDGVQGPEDDRNDDNESIDGEMNYNGASFHAFLARQCALERKKQQRIETAQAASVPTFQPELAGARSRMLAGEQDSGMSKGTFLERVARGAMKREHEAVRLKAAREDPDCTFTPKITARSAKRAARSAAEHSRGDQLRRETALRVCRLRAERELLENVTFRPALNDGPQARRAKGKLQLTEAPDTYVSRVAEKEQRRAELCARRTLEKEAREDEACTFVPATTSCPPYIKRIADSMAAAKAAQPKPPREQPDWR